MAKCVVSLVCHISDRSNNSFSIYHLTTCNKLILQINASFMHQYIKRVHELNVYVYIHT